MPRCYLGIEIGGTKLQIGVGRGGGAPLLELQRRAIEAGRGATGILEQIATTAGALVRQYDVAQIGIGFGGPVDTAAGRTVKSHQVDGWEGLPLADWCRQHLATPAVLANDCDVAALAEASLGAGRGKRCVFYVTVGTGVGGGLVVDGQPHAAGRPAAAEIGHLRPGLRATEPTATVESLASGPGLVAEAIGHIGRLAPHLAGDADLLRQRCGGDLTTLTVETLAAAAAEGDRLARSCLRDAVRSLGWAVAQTITLVAPEIVVVGGGVSLMGDHLFFAPLRAAVADYVFPPLAGSYEIVPAALGETVVVQGALLLADRQARRG